MKSLQWALIVFATLFLGTVLLLSVNVRSGQSRRSTCLSALKQAAVGSLIYAADFDNRFPDRDVWMDATQTYVRNENPFCCPILKEEEKNPQIYGYCFNGKLSQAKVPSAGAEKIPLVFESINLARNASGSIDSLPNPGRHKGSSDSASNGIAYADGHAKMEKMP